MLRLLLIVPLVAAGSAFSAPQALAAPGCAPGGAPAPPGAATRQVGDLDGDGLPDTLWVAATRLVGISTGSGANTQVRIASASPMPLRALLIDAQDDGRNEVIVSTGRNAHLFAFADCQLQTVVDNHYRRPFLFDLENLAGNGTGVGCSDLGDGRRLVGLQALQDGGQWTVRRTEIDLNGILASTGRSDTISAASAQDPVVTTAQTISCGNLTINQDGVQEP
ncbi:hypothetical protein [Mycobacterium asiaticum]|uniref:VCBS repeat-containing protein n=1 Tax=Mycobacterium asiaticum TaxID=1790 RepID=A0A1A3N351_MYCAS|nr:hypothetical protein [Mycobacterium asiaticum]OBK14792.1 hypothetical protein A5636_07190 [Mycobacterium asiaticum]